MLDEDDMTWIKLDDDFPQHPKILAVGDDGGWLYVCGLCYCGRYLTDGFIPAGALTRLTNLPRPEKLAERLVAQRLWDVVDGGWMVHDYTEKQSTKAAIEAQRAANAERQSRRRSRDSNAVTHDVSADEVSASEDREQKTDADEKQVVPARATPDRPPEFERFYAAYPRKRKPHDALRAWLKATKTTAPDVIQAALEAHAAVWVTWPKAEWNFIPHPSTWLNSGDYLSPPPEPKSGSKQQARQQTNRDALVEGIGKVDGRSFAERALGDRTSSDRQLPPGAIDTTAVEG